MPGLPQPTSAPQPYIWPPVYIGDDWSFAYDYQNPDGSALDLTGAAPQAILFGRFQTAPVFILSGTPAVTVLTPPSAGQVVFIVPRAITATLSADGCSDDYPTRIQVQLLDTLGKLTTFRVDGVQVDDARFARLEAPTSSPAPPPSP